VRASGKEHSRSRSNSSSSSSRKSSRQIKGNNATSLSSDRASKRSRRSDTNFEDDDSGSDYSDADMKSSVQLDSLVKKVALHVTPNIPGRSADDLDATKRAVRQVIADYSYVPRII
jgi:hypothetical protein